MLDEEHADTHAFTLILLIAFDRRRAVRAVYSQPDNINTIGFVRILYFHHAVRYTPTRAATSRTVLPEALAGERARHAGAPQRSIWQEKIQAPALMLCCLRQQNGCRLLSPSLGFPRRRLHAFAAFDTRQILVIVAPRCRCCFSVSRHATVRDVRRLQLPVAHCSRYTSY